MNQYPTILSLLTPEYQKRMVQMHYHEVAENSPQWNASFCYPEGLMRWWGARLPRHGLPVAGHARPRPVRRRHGRQLHPPDPHPARRPLHPESAHVVRRDHRLLGRRDPGDLDRHGPGLGPAHHVRVLEFHGDHRDLAPKYDEGHKLVGLDQEAILYDPEALVQPVRLFEHVVKSGTMRDPGQSWYYKPLPDQRAQRRRQADPGRTRRPRLRRLLRPALGPGLGRVFRKGWDKPDDDALPADIGDIFK